MKPLIFAALITLFSLTAAAQDTRRVHHCQAQCVSLNTACGSGIEGTVHGFSRSGARRAFSNMVAQCNARAGGVGIVLTDIGGFRMESTSRVMREGNYRHHWHPYWSSPAVSWATSCSLEIFGHAAHSTDEGVCWQEREDEIDAPYTGALPVRG